MSTMLMIFRVPPATADPWEFATTATDDRFPPLGAPAEVTERLNTELSGLGIDGTWTDENSGVILPDGVDSISFATADSQVRTILVNGPTGEILEALGNIRQTADWLVHDVATGEPY